MSTTATFRKSDDLADLIALASDVTASPPAREHLSMTAGEAARGLSGIVGWLCHRIGVIRMAECMGALARHQNAWRPGATFMRDLPVGYDGRADEYVVMIAVFSSSLAPMFGSTNMRAAMAFWATESDPAVWQKVVEAS